MVSCKDFYFFEGNFSTEKTQNLEGRKLKKRKNLNAGAREFVGFEFHIFPVAVYPVYRGVYQKNAGTWCTAMGVK